MWNPYCFSTPRDYPDSSRLTPLAHVPPHAHRLEETFWAVSDPAHARYGQHLTQKAVTDLVGLPTPTLRGMPFYTSCATLLTPHARLSPPSHLRSHASVVLCHVTEFFLFNTQWFSLGKYKNRDGTPCLCSAVNVAIPSVSASRKSVPPWMTSVGVRHLATFFMGECSVYLWRRWRRNGRDASHTQVRERSARLVRTIDSSPGK